VFLSKYFDQERNPVCTGISLVTTVAIEVVLFFAADALPHAGFGAIGVYLLAALAVIVGVVTNLVLGSIAVRRGEYRGGHIAEAGIFVWLVTILVLVGLPRYRADQRERSRTWGQDGGITDVMVQADGKLVLLGAGMVRLLPDGPQDPAFHRDYSFDRRGSLPRPPRDYWSGDGCAVTLPNGDLLFAAGGWIDRVFSDGRDGPSVSAGAPSDAYCSGLAVQPDGSILSGWFFGFAGRFTRNLPDGSQDPNFHPAAGPWSEPEEIVVQDTGKILLAGWVQTPPGNPESQTASNDGRCFSPLTRLNPDGTEDEGFHFFAQRCRPRSDVAVGPSAFAILSDRSMLAMFETSHAGRAFSEVAYVDANGVAPRRSALRDVLRGFRFISAIVPLSGGRVLVAGQRTSADPTTVERLSKEGIRDPSFVFRGTTGIVRKVLLQGEKLVILDGTGRVSRVNGDGSSDPTFSVPILNVYSH
jgi:hypothetical protein